MKTNKIIAGVMFTETGVAIERPFVENPPQRLFKDEMFTGKFLEQAKRIIKYRMAHCYHKLHANMSHATHITPLEIAWPGGHFNVLVWEELEKALELTDVRDLNVIQSQQIIRALMFGQCGTWLYDHDTTTWEKFKDGDIQLTDEFKLFITEHIVCIKWNAEVANQE
jgi:hypothetical protein